MRNRLAWVVGGIGVAGAVALRAVRRRPAAEPALAPPPSPAPEAQPTTDERAEELRRRLEEARAVVDEREDFEAGETPVDEVEPAVTPGDRRKHVHDRARASVERMRRSAPDE